MKCHYRLMLFVLFAPLTQAATETSTPTQQSTEAALTATTSAARLAQQWGLSTEEWSHYEKLKRGERGIWSPSLDPLTTLGVEAATDAERRRYADLLVEKEAQRVEKELAFQRAYDDAWKRRFPALTPVGTASVDITARLAVFVRENCPPCDTRLKTLLTSGYPLDIYLVDSRNDDSRLRRLALAWKIDAQRVQRRDITLNHDGGRWLQYGQGKMPAVLAKQGETWLPVTAP